MAFADLTANLNLNIANFSSKLGQASRQMSAFANRMERSYGAAARELTKHNFQLKDTARIVQGIVVAQAFYQAAGAIADATRSLWDFNVALDYMHVTYSALFGDTKIASDFMSVLQEHSINTIFDYQGLADASKKLLAYGIEYENLMFIMEGLTNLGTMSGDSAALDRIALALGQIYTKGKLSAEEMRQLANAYIPITEILQTKFGLTGDDLKRVGDLNLPAADVINAIVDYANENFASVGDAAMYTITGLQNKIVDTLKVVGAQMLTPITTAYKSFLVYVAKGLEGIRTAFEAGGIGGVFEYLVPDHQTQQVIRQFVANIRNLFMAIVSVGVVAGQVFGNFAVVFVNAFNIVSPIIIGFVNVLASMLNAMLQSRTGAILLRAAIVAAAGAFVILRVQAVAALVITAVTKAVAGLSKALLILASIVTKHPILSLLAGLAVALVGVSSVSDGANKAISGLFDTISGVGGGASGGDVLQDVEQGLNDSADAADQFSNRLNEAEQSADDLSKAIGGAGKAAKDAADKAGLLSFDEVFKLNDPNESNGGGGGGIGGGLLGDLENLAAGFSGLGDALIPEVPDFTDFIKDFTDGLFGGLEQGIFEKLKSTGIGALIGGGIGAIIGGLIGGPSGALLGAKIGAFAGGIVGLLWEAFDGAINNTITGAITGVASVIAGSFSKMFGTSITTAIASVFKGGSLKNAFAAIASAFKGAGLKSIAKGGIIGAAIGLLVDGIANLLWSSLEKRFDGADAGTAKVGQTIGGLIGSVIGMAFGPAGAIIGSAIGTFVGGLVGLFWGPIEEYFDPNNNALVRFFDNTIRGLTRWSSSTLTGFTTWWRNTSSGFASWWSTTTSGFSNWWDETIRGLNDWWDETVGIFTDWDAINADTLSNWWEDTSAGFNEWWGSTSTGLSTWWNSTSIGFNTWASTTKASLSGWWNDTIAGYNAWRASIGDAIFGFLESSIVAIVNWAVEAKNSIIQWANDTQIAYEEWKRESVDVLTGFSIAAYKVLEAGMLELYTSAKKWLSETKATWSTQWAEIKTNLSTWWNNLPGALDSWFNTTKAKNDARLSEIKATWGTRWTEIKANLSTWWHNLPGELDSWFTTTKAKNDARLSEIKATWGTRWTEIKASLRTWWNNLPGEIDAWFVATKAKNDTRLSEIKASWSTRWSEIKASLRTWWNNLPGEIGTWYGSTMSAISNGLSSIKQLWDNGWNSIKSGLRTWWSSLGTDTRSWLDDNIWKPIRDFFSIRNFWEKLRISLNDIKSKLRSWWENDVKGIFSGNISFNATANGNGVSLAGHAGGGVFNREHIARFAEGNKAEAIIPLENSGAMQPFVDAVAGGLTSYLAPLVANSGNSNNLPPLYVGTLIADDRGLRELYKKFEIIQVQENDRRGTPNTPVLA